MQEGSIVIIDDDEAMLLLLAEFFDSQGFDVRQFRTATSAVKELEAATDLAIQAVISDVNMPLMNGIEFMSWLKQRVSAPVILISAFGSQELEKQALEAGASFFMKKPFALSALKRAVDSVLKAS